MALKIALNIIHLVLKVGLYSLYAARATNLLTRAEPMQKHILDWGGRLWCFGRVVKNSILKG